MKTLLMLLALVALQGCATGRVGPAYVPVNRAVEYSPSDAGRALAVCRLRAISHDQETACMYLKGYSVERCNLDTRQPLQGKPVTFTAKPVSYGGTLPMAPNAQSLDDLE